MRNVGGGGGGGESEERAAIQHIEPDDILTN